MANQMIFYLYYFVVIWPIAYNQILIGLTSSELFFKELEKYLTKKIKKYLTEKLSCIQI